MSSNPHAWAYLRAMTGKNINIVAYGSMVKKYHQAQKDELLEQFCKAAQKIAVAAAKLTERQRQKYSSQRIKDGRAVFYLFDYWLPADVGAVVRRVEGVHIYR